MLQHFFGLIYKEMSLNTVTLVIHGKEFVSQINQIISKAQLHPILVIGNLLMKYFLIKDKVWQPVLVNNYVYGNSVIESADKNNFCS